MSFVFPYVSINGKIIPHETASIPALNNCVLSGEGVFTTIKVKNFIPLFFEKHQNRLFSNMKSLGFQNLPPHFSSLTAVRKLINKNKIPDCALRITILNGKKDPIVIINQRELPKITHPVAVITVKDTRDSLKTIKTINRLVNQQALKTAERNEANDALFIREGNIIESTYCNIFSINKSGELITPDLDERGLKGIAREVIMEQTRVSEETISEKTSGPLVMVNSLRLQKVSQLNGLPLKDAEVLFQKVKILMEKAEKQYLSIHTR